MNLTLFKKSILGMWGTVLFYLLLNGLQGVHDPHSLNERYSVTAIHLLNELYSLNEIHSLSISYSLNDYHILNE